MKTSRTLTAILVGAALLLPVVSFAQTNEPNNQMQALLQQLIAILEQELQQLLTQAHQNPQNPIPNVSPINIQLPWNVPPTHYFWFSTTTNPVPPVVATTTNVGYSCTTPSGATVPHGQVYTTNDWCPVGSMAMFCGSGPRLCQNGQWVSTQGNGNTGASCTTPSGGIVLNGGTYTTGNDCEHSLAMICPPATTLVCQNGQLVSTVHSTDALCIYLGRTYPNNAVQSFPSASCGTSAFNLATCPNIPQTCQNGTWAPTDQTTGGGSCVVHRYGCGDMTIPNGATAGNTRQCGVVCTPPMRCENGTMVSTGAYGAPQYETACPGSAFTL